MLIGNGAVCNKVRVFPPGNCLAAHSWTFKEAGFRSVNRWRAASRADLRSAGCDIVFRCYDYNSGIRRAYVYRVYTNRCTSPVIYDKLSKSIISSRSYRELYNLYFDRFEGVLDSLRGSYADAEI